MVSPGDFLTPIPPDARWRRLIQGGPLAIIDVLLSRPKNRGEHIIGLRKLCYFAAVEAGFSKQILQLKVAHAAVHGLITFRMDPEIIRPAYILLGWAMKQGSPGFKRTRIFLSKEKMNIAKISEEIMQNRWFRLDTGVMQGIEFLRSQLPEQGKPGAIAYPPEIELPPDDDELDEDNDEEEEQKAIDEDIRLEEERIRLETEEREFMERAAKAAADKEAKEYADAMAKKKAEKWLRQEEEKRKAERR
jgi:hypothetical protein